MMTANKSRLNEHKIEFVRLVSKYYQYLVNACQPGIPGLGDALVTPVRSVCNLRVILGSMITLQINQVSWSAYFHLKNCSTLGGSGATLTLKHVLWWCVVTSRLDYAIHCCAVCQPEKLQYFRTRSLQPTMRQNWSVTVHARVLTLHLCCTTCTGCGYPRYKLLFLVKHFLSRQTAPHTSLKCSRSGILGP